ncbi:TetR/AcrR family transcriptional regulator [Luteipulveratus mongoliensis]|uniref:HTH tetR-type domain-containing protein n=1 Tax=Luteipulveratus mongoliensis TaxID=571913 RepID=A0A0K1JE12_9MICO|nr:TetR/AcrR family transcriptional regulator [Luteipulveratus mongoliensis]AKU14944.1 hypothetical protein VV02_02125 [Luteipulveratus mongoliensis]
MADDVAQSLDELPPLPRYLQLLWDREAPGRRGPKPGRSITEIGEAGVRIADRDGIDAVSMKSVATELGLTTMSLYRYVDSKEELNAVMVDVALGEPDFAVTARGRWRTRLEAWARAGAAKRRAHPWVVDIAVPGPPLTPNTIAWMECGLRAFANTTLGEQQKLSTLLAIDSYVTDHVRMSVQFGLLGREHGGSEHADTYGLTLAQLIDADRFPSLTQAQSSFEDDDEDFFEAELSFGLKVFLDGVDVLVASAR